MRFNVCTVHDSESLLYFSSWSFSFDVLLLCYIMCFLFICSWCTAVMHTQHLILTSIGGRIGLFRYARCHSYHVLAYSGMHVVIATTYSGMHVAIATTY